MLSNISSASTSELLPRRSAVTISFEYLSPTKQQVEPVQAQCKGQVPLLRGKIHLALSIASPLWICFFLRLSFTSSSTSRSQFAVLLMILSCLINFSFSALLHNVKWSSDRAEFFCRRMDHLGIFIMIAGSCAPVPILLFSDSMLFLWAFYQVAAVVLGAVWCLVLSTSFCTEDTLFWRTLAYCVIGLANLSFTAEFRRVLAPSEGLMLAALATLYVIGACAYGRKAPNPWPRVFGYHEVFHSCCLIAILLTFALNYQVLCRC